MPQLNLETLVRVRSTNDRKIACEQQLPEIRHDYAAESYMVSKEDEFDWYDRNAVFERNGSMKPNSNAISISKGYVMNLKSKASIIGFPKLHKTTYTDSKFRRNSKPASGRFFPKRSRSSGKSNVPLSEPGSPKVSCIGRVRSKNDRSRRLRLQLQKEALPDLTVSRSAKSSGLWRSLKIALNLGRRKNQSVVTEEDKEGSSEKPVPNIIVTSEKRSISVTESCSELPGLGRMKRFQLGRRADSWGGSEAELEVNECDDDAGSVWSRRGMGPEIEVYCARDLECVGPASV